MSYEQWEPYYNEFGPMLIHILKETYKKNSETWVSTQMLNEAMTPVISDAHKGLSAIEVAEVMFKLIIWLPMNGHTKVDTVEGKTLMQWKEPV